MPVTVKVNGTSNSVVHKGSMHIAKSTAPDVCKTPSPAGPVPIPYPIIVSMSSDLANGTTTVKCDGKMVAVKDCEFSMCTGDEAGTAGGVVSSTFKKEAKFILFSFDVKFDGKNVCRLSDKLTMNHQNTICMAGAAGQPVSVEDLDAEMKEIAKECEEKIDTDPKTKDKGCTSRGRHKHTCCEREMKARKANDPKKYENIYPEHRAEGYRLDVAVVQNGKVTAIHDYKFNCPPNPQKMSAEQKKNYSEAFDVNPQVVMHR